MTQKESRLSRVIQRRLRLEGAFCFKVWGSEHMMAGLPDIIGCYKGYFFGLEVKRPETRGNVSARQEFVMGQIIAAEGIAGVVCSADEAVRFLRESIQNAEALRSHDDA